MSEETRNGFWGNVGYVLGGTAATALVGAIEGAMTGAALIPMLGRGGFLDPEAFEAATIASFIAACTGIFAGLPAFAVVITDRGPNAPFLTVMAGIAFHTMIGIAIPAVIGYAATSFDRDIAIPIYIYGIIVGFIVGTYVGVIKSSRRWRRELEENGSEEGGTEAVTIGSRG